MLQLIEDRGWHIANGNVQGDKEGEFTYVGSRGATVIDYAVTNTAGLEELTRFNVEERVESDHMPICLTFRLPRRQIRDKQGKGVKKKEIMCWSKESIEVFTNNTEKLEFNRTGVEDSWLELKAGIGKCIVKKSVRMKERKLGYRAWWDKECGREREEQRCYAKSGKMERAQERNTWQERQSSEKYVNRRKKRKEKRK